MKVYINESKSKPNLGYKIKEIHNLGIVKTKKEKYIQFYIL